MKSRISEFSYGFALTHELVIALGSLSAAPIFPSLIEEGKAGGGYDVKLEAPGIPLFIQFKRSDCLSTGNARETRAGVPLSTPYYRFEITAKADSEQHEMLIELDEAPNFVFYAAPMFHQKGEFDAAFLGGTVRQNSFYVRPTTIGSFADDASHHLSFDGRRCFVMSQPREIEAIGASDLEQLLRVRLKQEKRSLRQAVPEALTLAETARARSRERLRRREARIRPFDALDYIEVAAAPGALPPAEIFRRQQERSVPRAIASSGTDNPEMAPLQKLADIGLREFNAQLYIVQDKSGG